MARERWVLFFLLPLLLLVRLHGETWYLIPETELSRLETISKNWTRSRTEQLETLRRSQETVERLKNNSERLTISLQQEQEITRSLRKSFDVYAAAQQQRFSEETKARIKAETDLARNKIRYWRIVAALLVLAGIDVLYVVMRVKKIPGL